MKNQTRWQQRQALFTFSESKESEESNLGDDYLVCSGPSLKEIKAATHTKALNEFCKVKDSEYAQQFLKRYGIPTNRLIELGRPQGTDVSAEPQPDSTVIGIKHLIGLALTLRWTRYLIDCLNTEQSTYIKVLKVQPSRLELLEHWRQTLSKSDEQRLNKEWKDFSEMSPGALQQLLVLTGFIITAGEFKFGDETEKWLQAELSARKERNNIYKKLDPKFHKWLTDEMAKLNKQSWTVIVPSEDWLEQAGCNAPPLELTLFGNAPERDAVPYTIGELTIRPTKTIGSKPIKEHIYATLKKYFSEFLKINCKIAPQWERKLEPPAATYEMNTLLDGMIHALLNEWKPANFKRCSYRGCTSSFEFVRSTKQYCDGNCREYERRCREKDLINKSQKQ